MQNEVVLFEIKVGLLQNEQQTKLNFQISAQLPFKDSL